VVPDWILAALLPRKQQIGPLKTLAPLVALLTRPEQFCDREVILFVDNTQAVYTLASGYARQHDNARLVHMFHCMCAAIGAQVWLEYVPTGANLAVTSPAGVSSPCSSRWAVSISAGPLCGPTWRLRGRAFSSAYSTSMRQSRREPNGKRASA